MEKSGKLSFNWTVPVALPAARFHVAATVPRLTSIPSSTSRVPADVRFGTARPTCRKSVTPSTSRSPPIGVLSTSEATIGPSASDPG